ncbi:S8 family serine peptidase [Cellulomonas chengniuliangii]|uniref:S8 family serine peptidase n=1 Tax=Cellulomonas chengniuliangii TaxID=2968084 RepID=A0ABY5KWS0_9CELL|nr:S8 family serine peptidase [Cellulomonas chengniuliangii]MCC2309577.1 S8 family serine peptidase [Cellulomonas chengniuliangii]MCC2316849.1 S8 family serine peptidase [Cellulomonas chengniuliangii]UUI74869.1 S8 family serine peptidase [Cellulomonas chengniuliangii]
MIRSVETRRPLRRGAVALLALAALLATPAPATAADAGDGLWYFTQTGIAEAHQHTRGEGITIAVLDGPINAAVPELAGANLTVREPAYCSRTAGGPPMDTQSTDADATHATTIASLLLGSGAGAAGQAGVLGVAPGAQVLHYVVNFDGDRARALACLHVGGADTGDIVATAIDQAVADGADIISLSFSAHATDDLVDAIADAQRAGVILVAAVPNGDFEPHNSILESANGVVAVERSDVNGRSATETFEPSPWITVAAPGQELRALVPPWESYALTSGTSFATPYTAGVLALAWSVYPDATANQMIQSLIRNAGPDDQEPTRDAHLGYGIVSIERMLAHDPTAYPDENPLLRDDAEPSTAQILGEPAPGDDSTPAPLADTQDTASPGSSPGPLLLAAAGVLGLLVLAGIALAIVLTLRARRRSAQPASPPPTPGPWA